MARLQQILVARDFSSGSDPALTFALALARTTGAEVHTLYADVLEPDGFNPAVNRASTRDKLRSRLQQRATETIQTSGYDPEDVRITHEVIRDAAPAPAILTYADKNDIDLIVMGTHGRRGMRKALLGSVATEVVRLASCPVLTIRPNHGVTPEAVRNILVPVDFSERAKGAVRYADELADELGASLTLVHAIEFFSVPDIYGISPSAFVTKEVRHNIQQKLREYAGETSTEATYEILSGNPAVEIEDYAEENGVDLIVMPTRGQTGFKRFLMGSVAEKVISRASCPVLSAKDFESFLTVRAQ